MTRDAIGSPRLADPLGPMLADTVSWTAQCTPPFIAATELGHPAGVVACQLPTVGTQERPVGNRSQICRFIRMGPGRKSSTVASHEIAGDDRNLDRGDDKSQYRPARDDIFY